MDNGEDDDVDIYLNGKLVFSDHNHVAGDYHRLDVSPFIIPNATNIITVKHTDWYCCGYGMSILVYTSSASYCPPPFTLRVAKVTAVSATLKWALPTMNFFRKKAVYGN